MATRPAKQPLSVMPMSGLPSKIQAVAVAVSVAQAAAECSSSTEMSAISSRHRQPSCCPD